MGGEHVDADTLNSLVSSAIWRAEQLEGRGISAATQAWLEVSSVEGELAKVLPATESEGRIARRGAVRAALKAKDHCRAENLVKTYSDEDQAPETLKRELRKMLKEDDNAITARFRYASKRHTLRETRELVRRFREGGAFGLAT
jgi:hypothetical protein